MFLTKTSTVLSILLFLNTFILSANPIRCSTVEVFKRNAINHPDAILRKQQLETEIQQWIINKENNKQSETQALITIPVVVHVVYNTTEQNISDAQIISQITVLNKDFRNLNADRLASTHPYFNLTGNANIEFCLAIIDPNGDVTTGITRTTTTTTNFLDDDSVKFISSGGEDAWDATQYLNLWVCNLSDDDGLLGYAQFPSDLNTFPETDGVVIDYENFGTIGTVSAPFDLGRTATHEIGHWLNLQHIWGDEPDCNNDDNVSDTPLQATENFDCPTFPSVSCTNGPNGDLFMDYMDYTDDACMSLFTKGQVTRMQAVLNGVRSAIKTSNKCSGTTGLTQQKNGQIKIYPNPTQNYLTIEGIPQTKSRSFTVAIFNLLGEKVYSNSISTSPIQLETSGFKTGVYLLNIYNDEFVFTQKLTVVK